MIAYALGLSLSFMCVLYHNHGLAEAVYKTTEWNRHLRRLRCAKPWSVSGNHNRRGSLSETKRSSPSREGKEGFCPFCQQQPIFTVTKHFEKACLLLEATKRTSETNRLHTLEFTHFLTVKTHLTPMNKG